MKKLVVIFTTEYVNVECAAFELVNMHSKKKLPEAGFVGL